MRELIRDLLWLQLIVSLMLTWIGMYRAAPGLLLAAAALSFALAVLAIFSIGIFFLMLTVVQLGLALAVWIGQRRAG